MFDIKCLTLHETPYNPLVKLFQHIKKFHSVFFLLGLLVAVEGNVHADGHKGQLLAQNTTKTGFNDNKQSQAKVTRHAFSFVFHLVDLPLAKPCFEATNQYFQHKIDIAQRQNQREVLVVKPLLVSVKLTQQIFYSNSEVYPISLI